MPISQSQTSKAESEKLKVKSENVWPINSGAPKGLDMNFIPTPIPDKTIIKDAAAGKSQEYFGGKLNLSSKLPPSIKTSPPKIIPRKNLKGIMLKFGLAKII